MILECMAILCMHNYTECMLNIIRCPINLASRILHAILYLRGIGNTLKAEIHVLYIIHDN